MQRNDLVLGIDGGGTKTVAWLAARDADVVPLGHGGGGPGNFQTVGSETALANLDAAVDAAFADAGVERGMVAAAVVGLAGSDRGENLRILNEWAESRGLARRLRIVNDALPIIAAGSPDGWGIGLISGTGSFCFGRTADGRSARSGGWGYLFGDEGSAYALTVAGLRAAAKDTDGRGPRTVLVERFLKSLAIADPGDLIQLVYSVAADRAKIAALAKVVTQAAAAEDSVAKQIVDDGARELAVMVQAVARKLELDASPFPLALTGGVLCGDSTLRSRLETHLEKLELRADPITIVEHPVAGAVKLAQMEARKHNP